MDGVPEKTIFGTNTWLTNRITFVALANGTPLEIAAEQPGIWLDSFELRETGNMFYLPEEALELLEGQRALGEWKSNMGQPHRPAAELQRFTNHAAQLAIALGLRASGTAGGAVEWSQPQLQRHAGDEQVAYFVVETCADALNVLNRLDGRYGRLQLLADQSGLPTGDPLTDDYVPIINLDPVQVPPPTNGLADLELSLNSPLPALRDRGSVIICCAQRG